MTTDQLNERLRELTRMLANNSVITQPNESVRVFIRNLPDDALREATGTSGGQILKPTTGCPRYLGIISTQWGEIWLEGKAKEVVTTFK